MTMARLPTLFISHGSPMLALELAQPGPALTRIGQQLPKPKAILIISAHWLTRSTLTSSAMPETFMILAVFPTPYIHCSIQHPALLNWPETYGLC